MDVEHGQNAAAAGAQWAEWAVDAPAKHAAEADGDPEVADEWLAILEDSGRAEESDERAEEGTGPVAAAAAGAQAADCATSGTAAAALHAAAFPAAECSFHGVDEAPSAAEADAVPEALQVPGIVERWALQLPMDSWALQLDAAEEEEAMAAAYSLHGGDGAFDAPAPLPLTDKAEPMETPHMLIDGRFMTDARDHREGSLLQRGISCCMKLLSRCNTGRAMVGVSHNPVCRFRRYYYQGWAHMSVLLRDNNAGRVHMYEAGLIATLKALLLPCRHCRMAIGHEVANRQPGGEGPMATFAPPYFAYLVVCEDEEQGPAEARRWRSGRLLMKDWRHYFAEVEAGLQIYWQTSLYMDDGSGNG